MSRVALLFARCALLLLPLVARAAAPDVQTDWTLKPSVLHTSSPQHFAPALKYSLNTRYKNALTLRDDFAAVFESAGAVATLADANSENLYASFAAGYSHNFYNASIAPGQTVSSAPDAPLATLQQDTFSALVDVFGQARFEMDQRGRNRNFTYGPHFGFTPKHQTGWTYILPALYVDYQRVDVLRSETFRELGVAEKNFWRLDVGAGWYWPVGYELLRETPALRPLDLQFDLKYYRGFQLPAGARQADLDDAVYTAITVGYLLSEEPKSGGTFFQRYARYAYISVAHGRIPPAERSQTSVYVGLVLGRAH